MSTLTDILDSYSSYRGVKVYLKTNLAPRVLVYDADNPGGGGFVRAGITITDRNGSKIGNYGGEPQINYVLASSLVAIIGAAAILTLRGVVK